MTLHKLARLSVCVLASLVILIATGCSERLPAGPPASAAPHLSPGFFTAAVQFFDSTSYAPILVDPRPLRPELRLDSVGVNDLLASESEVIRMRTRVVESGGWRLTDAPRDWRCVWSQSLPPVIPQPEPDSVRRHKEECLSRAPYHSLVFGLPQARTDPAHPERWRIRTMRMLPNGYEVVDLFLVESPNGGWRVVEDRVRTGVFS